MRYALAVLLLLAILGVAGCGPGAASTTISAAAPTTASPTTTPAPPATTAPAGQLAWKFKAGDRAGAPAISGGLVYVVGNDGRNPEDKRYAATLHAVDAASGAERWKYTMVGDSVDASPAVSGGLVYVGGQDGFLYALDAASGAERWKQKTDLELELTSPVVSGGLVYVVGSGYICALDAASGAERWRFQSGAPVFASPVVSGGLVYVASSGDPGLEPAGSLYALDVASGAQRWKFNIVDGGIPVVSGGLVYVGDVDRYLYALDAVSGTERWKFDVGGAGSPAVSGGLVYVGGNDGYVYALDAASGAQRWRFKTLFWDFRSPAVSGDLVYAVASDNSREAGYVYALDAASGAQRWKLKVAGAGDASPVVSGGLVYVGSADGYLYAVPTGAGVASTAAIVDTSPTTTAGTSDTSSTEASESPTETTIAATPEVAKYVSEFMSWFLLDGTISHLDLERLENHLSDEGDVTTLSAADLQVAERATVHLHELSSLLHSIKAPAAAAEVHQKLVAGFDAEVAMQDKELLAMRNKDQAGVDAAKAAINDGDGPTPLDSAMEAWMEKYHEVAGLWSDAPTTTTLPTTQFEAAMMAWVKAFREWAGIGTGFEMSLDTYGNLLNDPAEVARAHGFGDQLRAIQPPAAMAAVHQKVVDAFDAWLAAVDKALAAGEAPSQAVLDSLGTEYDNAETAYEGAMEDWLIAQFPAFPWWPE